MTEKQQGPRLGLSHRAGNNLVCAVLCCAVCVDRLIAAVTTVSSLRMVICLGDSFVRSSVDVQSKARQPA